MPGYSRCTTCGYEEAETGNCVRCANDRVDQLEAAIRRHRDQRGDDRCWLDDEELYKTLPEGYAPPARDSEVEYGLCKKFIANRHDPRVEYVSPQRRIEELEKEAARLEAELRRLKLTHEGDGDTLGQANAWRHVWRACWDSGMCSRIEPILTRPPMDGLGRVLEWLRHREDKIAELGTAVRDMHRRASLEMRERCARVADGWAKEPDGPADGTFLNHDSLRMAREIAQSIRASEV